MKNVYIDADSFKNPQFVSQAIRIYTAKNNNINFLIKGKKEDLITISDYPVVTIKDNINESDLKDYPIRLIANDDFFSSFDGTSTIYRFTHKGKEFQSLIITLDENDSMDSILSKILKGKNIYRATTKKSSNDLSVCSLKAYKLSQNYKNNLKQVEGYKEEISIKDLFTTKYDIVLVDNESAYYLFNIIEALNNPERDKEAGKEKVKASFFSKKLFTFTRDQDEMDYDSLFFYYLIEIKKDVTYFHIKRLANLTALFKILYDIDEL